MLKICDLRLVGIYLSKISIFALICLHTSLGGYYKSDNVMLYSGNLTNSYILMLYDV